MEVCRAFSHVARSVAGANGVIGSQRRHVFLRSIEGTYSLFADTSVVLPGTVKGLEAGWFTFKRGLTHQLAVIAVDQNYFDYYHRTSDGLTATGLVMHLDGGIGVFGSVVTVAKRTIIAK